MVLPKTIKNMPVRMVNDDELESQNQGNDSGSSQNNVPRSGSNVDFGSLIRSLLNILPAIISVVQLVMQLFGRKKR